MEIKEHKCFVCGGRRECRMFWHGMPRTGMLDTWICLDCDEGHADVTKPLEKLAYMMGLKGYD